MSTTGADWQDRDVVQRLLTQTRTWAIVGLGDNPGRTAYSIAAYLQRQGKRIVPVHPRAESVLGEPGYPSLAAAVQGLDVPIDVVDVFRRSSEAGAVVDEAISLGIPGVWLQLGVVDVAAFDRARAQGVDVVMDTCPKIEWPRLA